MSLSMNLGPPASRRPVAVEAKNLAAGTAALPGIARWFKGLMRELFRGNLAPDTRLICGAEGHSTVSPKGIRQNVKLLVTPP